MTKVRFDGKYRYWNISDFNICCGKYSNLSGSVEISSFHHLIKEGLGLRHIVDYYYILNTLPDVKEGRPLLNEIMRGGSFGHYRIVNRKRNSAVRMFALLPHFPKEVLWVVPWKLWHKCWRLFNR